MRNSPMHRLWFAAATLFVVATLVGGAVVFAFTAPAPEGRPGGSWRTDPIWYEGKAEWALYDAVRPIYGVERRYEATLFTNKQSMDPETTTKASGSGGVEVFKHNLSEMIPTAHYTYRFVTTSFVETGSLAPYKVVASTQEDCGASYRQFVVDRGRVKARQFCYFPGAGEGMTEYVAPKRLAFHDALSLTLRDFPFDAPEKTTLDLVPDQTDTHETSLVAANATVEYVGRETVTVPFGALDTHHLRVTHPRDGGTTTSDFWFAADPEMLHVMVKYAGPYGVRYELKKHGWWAYWNQSEPAPM
jgi:hypothetical protein